MYVDPKNLELKEFLEGLKNNNREWSIFPTPEANPEYEKSTMVDSVFEDCIKENSFPDSLDLDEYKFQTVINDEKSTPEDILDYLMYPIGYVSFIEKALKFGYWAIFSSYIIDNKSQPMVLKPVLYLYRTFFYAEIPLVVTPFPRFFVIKKIKDKKDIEGELISNDAIRDLIYFTPLRSEESGLMFMNYFDVVPLTHDEFGKLLFQTKYDLIASLKEVNVDVDRALEYFKKNYENAKKFMNNVNKSSTDQKK